MKIAIVGAGAMGSTLGALLQLGGAEVVLVDPYEAHMRAVREKGLSLLCNGTTYNVNGITAVSSPADAGKADVMILMVKASYSEAALEQSAGIRDGQTVLVSFQNGLGHEEILRRYAAPTRIIYGCLNITGRLLQPGVVKATVLNPDESILFGMYEEDDYIRAAAKALEDCFNRSSLAGARVTKEINTKIWNKALINCALNPLGAILRMTAPQMIRDPNARALMTATAREVETVARARGIENVDANRFIDVLMPQFEKGPENYPSMASDVLITQKKTEIEHLNGAVARMAEEAGVEAPMCKVLTAMIRALEENYAVLYHG